MYKLLQFEDGTVGLLQFESENNKISYDIIKTEFEKETSKNFQTTKLPLNIKMASFPLIKNGTIGHIIFTINSNDDNQEIAKSIISITNKIIDSLSKNPKLAKMQFIKYTNHDIEALESHLSEHDYSKGDNYDIDINFKNVGYVDRNYVGPESQNLKSILTDSSTILFDIAKRQLSNKFNVTISEMTRTSLKIDDTSKDPFAIINFDATVSGLKKHIDAYQLCDGIYHIIYDVDSVNIANREILTKIKSLSDEYEVNSCRIEQKLNAELYAKNKNAVEKINSTFRISQNRYYFRDINKFTFDLDKQEVSIYIYLSLRHK